MLFHAVQESDQNGQACKVLLTRLLLMSLSAGLASSQTIISIASSTLEETGDLDKLKQEY